MNTLPFLRTLAGTIAGLVFMLQAAIAGLPQPMCVYYGQARDGYGLPYRTNAVVMLYNGTNEVARQTISRALTPGINFALYAHLDDGRSSVPYSRRALRTGDLVSIKVRDRQGLKTIMENQAVPTVGQPGDLILINVTAADDLDRDGLPDVWEWELIDWSWGMLRGLTDVRGEDDFDGDGMTNLQEYRAGTFAFLDYDYLYVEQLSRTANNRLKLTFFGISGKVYSIRVAPSLQQPSWQTCPFATSDSAPFSEIPVEGNGDWLSLYVPLDAATWFFRIEAW